MLRLGEGRRGVVLPLVGGSRVSWSFDASKGWMSHTNKRWDVVMDGPIRYIMIRNV